MQCSCTFPFVFRPVEGRFVDGGVLSNLPIIFFPNKKGDIERTIAFTLKQEQDESEENELLDYVQSLVNTITEGATKIQMMERKKTATIEVCTRLGLFDFDKINHDNVDCQRSISLGSQAVDDFLQNERRTFLVTSEKSLDSFTNIEQIYNQVIFYSSWLQNAQRVVVSFPTLEWAWSLFVPLAWLRKRGVVIDAYTEGTFTNGEKADIQEARIRQLQHMGIDVRVSEELEIPAYGFFFMRDGFWRGVAVCVERENGKRHVFGKILASAKVDRKTVAALVLSIEHEVNYSLFQKIEPVPFTVIRVANLNHIQKVLQNRPVYNRAVFNEMVLAIEDLIFMDNSVNGYRYRTMDLLDDLFSPLDSSMLATIELAAGKQSPTCPVLVDEVGGEFFVIEGHARLLHKYRHGVREVMCVVSHRSSRIIAGPHFKIKDLFITDMNYEKGTKTNYRLDAHSKKATRGIEGALRNPRTYLI